MKSLALQTVGVGEALFLKSDSADHPSIHVRLLRYLESDRPSLALAEVEILDGPWKGEVQILEIPRS
jgi:hypothetical protein